MVLSYANYASGNYARAEGNESKAQGTNSHCEGYGGNATGNSSHVEGFQCYAAGSSAHSQGQGCSADGDYSHAQGFYARARHQAQTARAGAGNFGGSGDSQACGYVMLTQTTDAAPKIMSFDKNVPSSFGSTRATVLPLEFSTAMRYRISLVMRRTDVLGDAGAWSFEGLTVRAASGPTTLVTTSVNGAAHLAAGGGGTGYAAAVAVGIINAAEHLELKVTGLAGATVRWVANLETVEVW